MQHRKHIFNDTSKRNQNLSVTLILVLDTLYTSNLARYFAYGPLVAYTVIYLWKNNFTYKIVERVLFGLGEAAAITLFSLYLFGNSYIIQYDLDFFALGLIIFLDVIFYTVKLVSWLKYGKVSIDKINPE